MAKYMVEVFSSPDSHIILVLSEVNNATSSVATERSIHKDSKFPMSVNETSINCYRESFTRS